jgi:uncharacterized small protein (DUF1192 family)
MLSSCDSFDSEQLERDASSSPIAEYRETIALLHEEIARLEQELQMRDDARKETRSSGEGALEDEAKAPGTLEHPGDQDGELERLAAELAGRDETIRLLLDEVSRVEEAQAATRAEWEHLAEWVAVLEHRVEGQDADALHQLENRLAAEEQKAGALAVRVEQERRSWEAQRQIYQAEIARLEGTLDQIASSPDAPGDRDGRAAQEPGPNSGVVAALQAENLRLRAAWQELVERNSAADRSKVLEAKLVETTNERNQLRRQIEHIQDERKRERLEHEATVAELQARLSQAALGQPQAPPSEERSEGIADLDIDLRIRALRQHFRETDEREKEERRHKQLISRLSRLWSRTGPR